jgi:Glycosyl transferases group 1
MKIYIVGSNAPASLEQSYFAALHALGHEVVIYPIEAEFQMYIRFGRVGRVVSQFVAIDAWRQKLNRHLALSIQSANPDVVLVFGNARILFSTLAFVKSVLNCPFLLVWPDPLTSLQTHVCDAAALYDGVATYCQASVPIFTRLGFRNAQWIPLAADPTLHAPRSTTGQFAYDITFLGAWRPEREQALTSLIRHFPTQRIGIWGGEWTRKASRSLRPYTHTEPLVGQDYATMLGQSRINLNVIDHTCYPAANMRFFEILVAGGLQLASDCPEMASVFRANEHVLYFQDQASLCATVEYALANPDKMTTVREAGTRLVNQRHTYSHRAAQILTMLN